jgi:hypothetical protein
LLTLTTSNSGMNAFTHFSTYSVKGSHIEPLRWLPGRRAVSPCERSAGTLMIDTPEPDVGWPTK